MSKPILSAARHLSHITYLVSTCAGPVDEGAKPYGITRPLAHWPSPAPDRSPEWASNSALAPGTAVWITHPPRGSSPSRGCPCTPSLRTRALHAAGHRTPLALCPSVIISIFVWLLCYCCAFGCCRQPPSGDRGTAKPDQQRGRWGGMELMFK